IELCGGTHVAHTGNIGMVRIVNESSIAAGVRRIEAVTGSGVEKMLDEMQDNMQNLANLLGGHADVFAAVDKALKENASLKEQIDDFMTERVKNMTNEILGNARDVNGVKVAYLTGVRLPDIVKAIAFEVRKSATSPTAFIAATVSPDGKPLLTVALTDDLVKQGCNASKAVREAAKLIKGGGGGQPFFAQAGGKDADALSAAGDKLIGLLGLS
ncbi:MAG: alanine--tRNA ligase, partial [Muribaculaceae bacterium]|nr:alanine--tRNA ligase [Muribaculaceae bacterium]